MSCRNAVPCVIRGARVRIGSSGDDFEVSTTLGGLGAGSTVLVQDRERGAYNATTTLSRVGDYVFAVTLDGTLIGTAARAEGATYFISVGAGELSPRDCVVTGAGLVGAEAGTLGLVNILSVDSEGNRLGGGQFTSNRCTSRMVPVGAWAALGCFESPWE